MEQSTSLGAGMLAVEQTLPKADFWVGGDVMLPWSSLLYPGPFPHGHPLIQPLLVPLAPPALVSKALPAPLLHQSVLELRDCLLCGAFTDSDALALL